MEPSEANRSRPRLQLINLVFKEPEATGHACVYAGVLS
jgi:hypothetical protein